MDGGEKLFVGSAEGTVTYVFEPLQSLIGEIIGLTVLFEVIDPLAEDGLEILESNGHSEWWFGCRKLRRVK